MSATAYLTKNADGTAYHLELQQRLHAPALHADLVQALATHALLLDLEQVAPSLREHTVVTQYFETQMQRTRVWCALYELGCILDRMVPVGRYVNMDASWAYYRRESHHAFMEQELYAVASVAGMTPCIQQWGARWVYGVQRLSPCATISSLPEIHDDKQCVPTPQLLQELQAASYDVERLGHVASWRM